MIWWRLTKVVSDHDKGHNNSKFLFHHTSRWSTLNCYSSCYMYIYYYWHGVCVCVCVVEEWSYMTVCVCEVLPLPKSMKMSFSVMCVCLMTSATNSNDVSPYTCRESEKQGSWLWSKGWREGRVRVREREGEGGREGERRHPTNLRGEWFIRVELLRVGDRSVVDLVHDMLQQGLWWRGVYTGRRLPPRPLFVRVCVSVCGSLDHKAEMILNLDKMHNETLHPTDDLWTSLTRWSRTIATTFHHAGCNLCVFQVLPQLTFVFTV